MSHRAHILAVHDYRLEDRVVAQTIRNRHGHGADTGDLTHLSWLGVTTAERGMVDPHHDGCAWSFGVPRAAAGLGQGDQRVEGKRVGPFTTACVAGSPKEITLVWLERSHDPRRGIGRSPHVDAACAVDVPPVAQRACLVDRLIAGPLVGARCRPHTGTLILESPDAVTSGAVQEQPLGARIGQRGGDHLVDLHRRQLPAPERSLGLREFLEARRGLDRGASVTQGRATCRRQPCSRITKRSGVGPRAGLLDATHGERLPRGGKALDRGELLHKPARARPVEA